MSFDSIKDYTIVAGPNDDVVADLVKQHISEGWEPIGGIIIAMHQLSGAVWAQAMIKRRISRDALIKEAHQRRIKRMDEDEGQNEQ